MILDLFDLALHRLGLQNVPLSLSRALLVVVLVLLAWLIYFLVRRVLKRGFASLANRTETEWDNLILDAGVMERLSLLAPAVLLFASASAIFPEEQDALIRSFYQRGVNLWMIVIGMGAVTSLLDTLASFAHERPGTRDKPIRSYVQVAKILVWIASSILAVAVLIDKSPWALLTGLGALTAVLLLVFKESILGFVASVQIAGYDLVRVGEWIEVPAYGADGDVLDVSLHTIRIQNWDKTIVSLPTTALLSSGFKNWRGMSESGVRRIKRSLTLDMTSVRFLETEEVERLSGVSFLKEYFERKAEELDSWNETMGSGDFLRRRRLTNLGTLRAYVEEYLRQHPHISQEQTFLVRQLAPGSEGVPIEIYVFSNEQRWEQYEAIIGDIFDHLLAVLPQFDLRVFQNPTGTDLRGLIGRDGQNTA